MNLYTIVLCVFPLFPRFLHFLLLSFFLLSSFLLLLFFFPFFYFCIRQKREISGLEEQLMAARAALEKVEEQYKSQANKLEKRVSQLQLEKRQSEDLLAQKLDEEAHTQVLPRSLLVCLCPP